MGQLHGIRPLVRYTRLLYQVCLVPLFVHKRIKNNLFLPVVSHLLIGPPYRTRHTREAAGSVDVGTSTLERHVRRGRWHLRFRMSLVLCV